MARVRVEVPVEKPATQYQAASPQQPVERQPGASRHLTKTNLLIAGGVVLLVLVIGFLITDRNKLRTEIKQQSGSQSSTSNDSVKYQEEVSKIVNVPAGVTPVTGVLTADKLAQLAETNSLYRDAKPEDVFLLYANEDKSRFLVIYRPTTKKVIQAVLDTTAQNTTTKP